MLLVFILGHTVLPICLKSSKEGCVFTSAAHIQKKKGVSCECGQIWLRTMSFPHTFHLHAHTWWDETQDGKRRSQAWTLVLLLCSSVELHGTWDFKFEPVLPGYKVYLSSRGTNHILFSISLISNLLIFTKMVYGLPLYPCSGPINAWDEPNEQKILLS